MTSRPAPTRPDSIRRHNLAVTLSHVHRDGALTRAELTARLGLSRSTVGTLVSDLTELGVLQEFVPSGGAGVGRPSHVVAPSACGPFVLAVDLDVSRLTVAAVGLGGVVLSREVHPTQRESPTPETVARMVLEALPRLCPAGHRDGRPAGVGVSVPGTVSRADGTVAVAPNLGWHDEPLGALLAKMMPADVPVRVGNDADLAVLAEHRRGNGRDCSDLVFLMGRIGLGAGLIVGDLPVGGHDGYAGEIGHNVIDATGPPCHCGRRGCIETFVGGAALLSLAGRPLPATDEAVIALVTDAVAGDERAGIAVRAVAEPLGRAIANLLNTLNPQRVLLGGTLAGVLDVARFELEQSVHRYALEASSRSVQLLAPALGQDSALLGAAEVAFAALLADPLTSAGV